MGMPRFTRIADLIHRLGLDRSVGIWFILLPAWWSLAIAARGEPNAPLMIFFALGALVAHMAASLLLKDTYPLPSGNSHIRQWWVPLILNLGALLGWIAARGRFESEALYLYAAAVFWTLGARSVASADTSALRIVAAVNYVIAFAMLTLAAWPLLVGLRPQFLLGLAAIQLAWQIATLKPGNPANQKTRFESNRIFGLLALVALIVNNLAYRLPHWVEAEFFGKHPPCVRYVHNPDDLVCPD